MKIRTFSQFEDSEYKYGVFLNSNLDLEKCSSGIQTLWGDWHENLPSG